MLLDVASIALSSSNYVREGQDMLACELCLSIRCFNWLYTLVEQAFWHQRLPNDGLNVSLL